MKFRLIALAFLLCTICAAADKKRAEPSLEITIASTSQTIKDALVSRLVGDNGFSVDSDGTYQIVVSREVSGGRGAFANAFFGSAGSQKARDVLTFSLSPTSDGATMLRVVSMETVIVNRFGGAQKIANTNKKSRQAISDFLAQIKASVEARKS